MRAIVQRRYGPAEQVLSLGEVDAPLPRDNEVLVRVRASSLHPDVWHAVAGLPWIFRAIGAGVVRPKQPIPGMDVAGIVEAIGAKVTRFKRGDEVFGPTLYMRIGNGGAFAERASVREDMLVRKPSHVTFEQAATLPTTGIIALLNLRPDRISRGHHVLINGAGGNVGSLAVQMAKARGARVTGVDAAHKLDLVRSLGADRTIDYTREDFTLGNERYDVILDVASTASLAACKSVLTPTGRYSLIGHDHFGRASGRVLGSLPRMIGFMIRRSFEKNSEKLDTRLPPIAELMETLRQQLEMNVLTPVIGETFPLEEVLKAMRCLIEGSVVGRIAITVSA